MFPYRAVLEPPPDLVGAADAQVILDVSESRLAQIRHLHDDFPPPALTVRGRPLWWRSDVEMWAEAHAERRERHRRKNPSTSTAHA